MRSVIAALSMVIAATALAQTNPNTVRITFSGFGSSGYDTLIEQDIYYRGAIFNGGTLSSGYSTNNPTYVSPCWLRCGPITIDLPAGSTDVSFDVSGNSNYWPYIWRPIYMYHDGGTTTIGPTVYTDNDGRPTGGWFEHVIIGDGPPNFGPVITCVVPGC